MRIIFNTTFIVNESIETEWISFIRKYYLAYLRQNRLTQDILFTKVSIDQPEGKPILYNWFSTVRKLWIVS